jgi:hypothetical protein
MLFRGSGREKSKRLLEDGGAADGKGFDLGDHGSFYAARCGTDTDLRDKD